MTRRAKLSLDPKQQSKAAPPHGFEQRAPGIPDDATAGAEAAPVARPAAGAGKDVQSVRARWQAHRPQADPTAGAAAGPSAGGVPPESVAERPAPRPAAHMASALNARVRELSRRPMVRAVAVGVAAGLAVLLLRRRLF
jgi:hypothetical protein